MPLILLVNVYLIKIIVEATLVTSPIFKELVLTISLQLWQQTKTSTIKFLEGKHMENGYENWVWLTSTHYKGIMIMSTYSSSR